MTCLVSPRGGCRHCSDLREGQEPLITFTRPVGGCSETKPSVVPPERGINSSAEIRLSVTFGFHPQLHGPLTAWASLRESDADCTDIAVVFRCLKPTVLLDLECDDLKIRGAGN